MVVHLFGATSSPSVANFALKAVADKFESECGKKAADFVKNDFYVDVGLKSVATVEETVSLIKNSVKLCKLGGFDLHNFVTNNSEVLHRIDPQKINLSVQTVE